MRLDNYCPNISMETTFMNTENSKTSLFIAFHIDYTYEAPINMLVFETCVFITRGKI